MLTTARMVFLKDKVDTVTSSPCGSDKGKLLPPGLRGPRLGWLLSPSPFTASQASFYFVGTDSVPGGTVPSLHVCQPLERRAALGPSQLACVSPGSPLRRHFLPTHFLQSPYHSREVFRAGFLVSELQESRGLVCLVLCCVYRA